MVKSSYYAVSDKNYDNRNKNNEIPRSRVVVFPDDICAAICRPICGSFVDTTRCGPTLPIVYTLDSPRRTSNNENSVVSQ